MGLYESMQTSKQLENNGIWLDLEHTQILLARAGGANTKFNAAAEKIAREHKRVMAMDLMSSEKGKQLIFALYAEHVVLDWETQVPEGYTGPEAPGHVPGYVKGIARPGGVIVPVTTENIEETFRDLEAVFLVLKETAESHSGFKQSLLEGVSGN